MRSAPPDFPFQHEDIDLSSAEINAAAGWIETLSGPFAPDRYTDSYQSALRALVQAKIDGLDVVAPTAAAQETGTKDLLTALQTGAEATRAPAAKPTRRRASVSKAKAAERKAAAAKTTANRAASRAKKTSTAGKSAH
jgi:DNA end-binding protein Ku